MIKDIEFYLKKVFFTEKYLLNKRLKRSIFKNYEKELSIIDKFKDLSKDAIDIGVYRGVYSYKLSKAFKHVYSFEPNPLIYPYLNKNLTKIINNMTLMNFAISDNNGDVELKIPNRNKSIFKDNVEEIYRLGCATIHKDNNFDKFETFKVKKKRLDEIIIDKNIGFIKIDVEGHEKEVLLGAEKIIKKSKPIMLIEIEEKHTKKPVTETINYILNLGYECYFLNKNDLVEIKKIEDINQENNFIFLPN